MNFTSLRAYFSKPWVLANLVLGFMLSLLLIVSYFPDFIEQWYSEGLYPQICHVLHPLMNKYPFSIGDVLLVILIVGLLFMFVLLIFFLFRRHFKAVRALLAKGLLLLQIILLLFYLFWGMNYFRVDAAKRLGLEMKSYPPKTLQTLTLLLIDSANACRARLGKADTLQPDAPMFRTAAEAIKALPGTGLVGTRSILPKVKASQLSFLMNYLTTEGYYDPLTSEAQINSTMPCFLKPVTACHEMSHQMGFATEDEANFIGFVAGTTSGDRLLRYSAYYLGMAECMYALRGQDSVLYKRIRPRISVAVMRDLKADRAYWKHYEGQISWLSGIFYDRYLKANNQPQGLNTYNQMLRLLMSWYIKCGYLSS